eukprot:10373992-Alexandrium_andersonii.AAC.1
MKIDDRFGELFASDLDKDCRALLDLNVKGLSSSNIYSDCTSRNRSPLPKVRFYSAGFPCQPFSCVGLRRGVKDGARGTVIFIIMQNDRGDPASRLHARKRAGAAHGAQGHVQGDPRSLGGDARCLTSSKRDSGSPEDSSRN